MGSDRVADLARLVQAAGSGAVGTAEEPAVDLHAMPDDPAAAVLAHRRQPVRILEWIGQLDEVNTEGVEPMSGVVRMRLPRRGDVVTEGDCRDRILANAPDAAHGFFAVPKVVE